MDESLYAKILKDLESPDHDAGLSRRYGIPEAVIQMILNQKVVEETKGGRFHRMKNNSPGFKELHDAGKTVEEMARDSRFPPALMAAFILEELGYGKKRIKRVLKEPGLIREPGLRREVEEALRGDFVYSPWAHRLQEKRAALGEEIIKKWLVSRGVEFTEEAELGPGKTPDFLVEGLRIEGTEVTWIDSKASFGSPQEHRKNMRRQFRHYLEEFGPGMAVYWFGYVDGIGGNGVVVKDGGFFQDFEGDIQRLFDLVGGMG